MIIELLRNKLIEARKSSNKAVMTIVQVILGEVATQKGRTGVEPSDEQVETLIRGLRDRNNETLVLIAGKNRELDEVTLKEENVFLTGLLPQTLSVEEIKVVLSEICDTIKSAKVVGQAMGPSMKLLKSKGLKVLGDDVKKAVEEMRI